MGFTVGIIIGIFIGSFFKPLNVLKKLKTVILHFLTDGKYKESKSNQSLKVVETSSWEPCKVCKECKSKVKTDRYGFVELECCTNCGFVSSGLFYKDASFREIKYEDGTTDVEFKTARY